MESRTVADRLKALELAIAHQDHGAPAPYGVWHGAVKAIRAEVEAVAKEMHDPDNSEESGTMCGLADRLAKEKP